MTETIKVKTQDLAGPALDWAVATCLGYGNLNHNPHRFDDRFIMDSPGKESGAAFLEDLNYSADWRKAGLLIDEEGISINFHPNEDPAWTASSDKTRAAYMSGASENALIRGQTAVVAAMRCYVASKLGAEIDIPTDLIAEAPAAKSVTRIRKP